jgi:hypothetical protein
MFVKPRAGLQIRDPFRGTFLPASGAEVPETSFWLRRIAGGDVVLVDQSQNKVLPSKNKSEPEGK